MKVNFKKIGVEVEADAESLIEKGINAHENDWKEKLESKTKTIMYKNVIAFGVISGDEAKEIEKTTDRDNIDDCHEYMVLYFSDGTISTFRNSYVDLFII